MGILTVEEMAQADVPTPKANNLSLFADSADSKFKQKDDAGVVTDLGGGGGGGTMSNFIVSGDAGANQTITDGQTVNLDGTSPIAVTMSDAGGGVKKATIAGTNLAVTTGNVFTGVHDFGGADSLEVPNSAAPVVDAAGELALDTTIASHKPLLTYYSGAATMYAIGILTADLTTTDNHAVIYDSANQKFKMAPPVNAAYALKAGDSYTGAHDFGGADSLEVPNSAAPTVDATGELALDTTIASHQPMLTYYNGAAAMLVPAILTADLTTTNNHVILYDSANSKFKMGALTATSNPSALKVTTTDVDFASSVAENTVFTYTVPGGTLGTSALLHLRLIGTEADDTGNVTVKVKYGATTIGTPVNAVAMNDVGTYYSFILDVYIKSDGATNAQENIMALQCSVPGDLTRPYWFHVTSTAAEDSTANKDLVVTFQFSANNANDKVHIMAATVVLYTVV